jgi:hypothetical protein
MNIKRTLCLLLALMMAFSVVFPSAIYADDEIELYEEEYVDYAEPIEEEMIIDEVIDEEEQIVEEAVVEEAIVEEDASLIDEDDSVTAEAEQQNEEQLTVGEITLVEAETFGAAPTIVTQPQDTTAEIGQYATVTVEAQGSGTLTYQWYYKAASDTAFKASSAKTNTYRIKMTAAWDGMQIYCKVSNGTSSVDSEIATLSLPSDITITKQPQDTTAEIGQYATITVEAEGENLTYQWYYKAASDTAFKASSAKTNTYRIKMTAAWDGMQIYCKVSNGTSSVDSEIATLSLPAIVSDDFVFEKIEGTNNLVLVEYKGTGVARIKVPNIVDGMTVTEIGAGVFEGKAELTAVELPNSITAIRERAFKNCTNLSTMTTY